VQGPYEWHMMDAWLANGFVGEDLLVNRAGDSDWIALRDMAAKRAREGPRAPRRPGGAAPPPAPRPGASNAAEVEKKPIGDSDVDTSTSGEKKRPVAVSSRYTESVDARIARLVAEGKFGPALTRLATGRGKAGELLAAGGGLASGRSSPALGAASPASDAVGAKRKSPLGEDAEKGASKKRATATSETANEKEKEKPSDKIKNEWRHADGYAQLPVFEPAKPVEVPSGATKNAAPDPRKKRSLSSSDKKRSESETLDKRLDLPVPAWCVEDAIERRRMASGFDRGGPRPAADPKADDSDGEGSDVSWSALPGTGEPAELLEERKKAKQEAMSRANADLEAAEAAAAAARAAAAAASAEAPPPADAEAAAARRAEAELALCALEPFRGEWRVPVASDGWRWRDDGMDAETLRRELDEAGERGPRRVVARREVDDAFRVFGVPGYGEALRGALVDETAKKRMTPTTFDQTSTAKTGEDENDPKREVTGSGSGSGGGFVQVTVSAAKNASSSEIRAWFESTTERAEPKSPKRAASGDDSIRDIGETDLDLARELALAKASSSNQSASEWFEAFTKDVAVASHGEARQKRRGATKDEKAETRPEAASALKKTPVVATMAPSEAQEGACARVMGALHDAVMRQRARVFYELIRDDIKRYV
jgi:hypothetical protein